MFIWINNNYNLIIFKFTYFLDLFLVFEFNIVNYICFKAFKLVFLIHGLLSIKSLKNIK